MARSVLRVLAVMFFALLLSLNAITVSARVVIAPTYDISKIDCTLPDAEMQVACGKILAKRSRKPANAIVPRASETVTSAASTTDTPGVNSTTGSTSNGSSGQTLMIVIAIFAAIFAGFLVYFAWQCLGFACRGRSGQPTFGYVGV
ncbi:hypothetical protein BDV93DRAFT_523078 [Ceratobasidium sp. AG-I]|nr:hypothetical protein BDV93DRAFT_523078 [Ceratobasidium sp. AG-I]